jgi:hypothetical protein
MDRVQRDDFMYALGQTMEFYGKTLDKQAFSFWYSAMGNRSVEHIKMALKEYVKIGKFAPRPANIMELLESTRTPESAALKIAPPMTTNCPPEIAQAWMWFIGRIAKGSNLDGLFSDKLNIDVDTQEKWLHLVNHEARANNEPDAIPDEYKLAEVWG